MEEQLLNHVFSAAREGDASNVLDTIDKWCWQQGHWMMHVGDKKGDLLTTQVRDAVSRTEAGKLTIIEVGGYCGYSAVRIGRELREGDRLFSIEIKPLHAAIATKILEYAGLSDRVKVVVGTVETKLAWLKTHVVEGRGGADLVFLDHSKEHYLPDFKRLEESGVVRKETVVVADNCLYPGCPDYVEYITTNSNYDSKRYESELEYKEGRPDHVYVSRRK